MASRGERSSRLIPLSFAVPGGLAFALLGPGAELLVLRELPQHLHVHPVRVPLQDLAAPVGDLRDAARRAVEQASLGQVGNRPGHAVGEQRLPAAWQHHGPVFVTDMHLGCKTVAQISWCMRLTVLVNGQARSHQRLEVRNRHTSLRRSEQARAGKTPRIAGSDPQN